MQLPIWFTVLLTILLPITTAARLAIHLPSSHASALASSSVGTSAVLHSSPPIRAPLSRWGGFSIDLRSVASRQNATSEKYLLDIYSKQYVFAPLMITLDKTGHVTGVWEVKRGETWKPGEGMRSVEYNRGEDGTVSLTARVLGQRNFYEERPGFSPLDLMKNPMLILAVVALGITFGMPYLMENMDPETKAEFEEQRKKGVLSQLTSGGGSEAPPNPANFDLAGWMAGKQTSLSAGSGKESASGNDARKGDARKRG